MNKLYFIFVFVFVLTSCEQAITDFKIDQPAESRLLVYAFPSDADDYLLNVSVTKSVYNKQQALDNIHVTCTTNGKPDEVTLLNTETHYGLPIAVFKVHGQHKSGDEIRVKVESTGLPTAEGHTIIPLATEFTMEDVSEAKIDYSTYKIFKISFHDHPSTDYYAVRAMQIQYPYNPGDEPYYSTGNANTNIYSESNYYYSNQIRYNFYSILTDREPLLDSYVDLNLDPWEEQYKDMYTFTDKNIKDPDVTMHLYAESCYGDCTLQFFTLSQEFYKMLDRTNSQKNNELGTVGLSQMYSTFNNIHGGFGCIAGYTVRMYEHKIEINKDEKMVY